MRVLVLAMVLATLVGCSKNDPSNAQVSGTTASSAQPASLTHQQALDKVYGNIHSNSLKDSKK